MTINDKMIFLSRILENEKRELTACSFGHVLRCCCFFVCFFLSYHLHQTSRHFCRTRDANAPKRHTHPPHLPSSVFAFVGAKRHVARRTLHTLLTQTFRLRRPVPPPVRRFCRGSRHYGQNQAGMHSGHVLARCCSTLCMHIMLCIYSMYVLCYIVQRYLVGM